MRAQDPSPQVMKQEPTGTPSASGPGVFAGTMMVVAGIWHGLIGLAGLAHDTLLVRADGYIYTFDLTAWAWVHLLLGAVVGVVGVMVRRGMPWAALSGLVLVGTSLLVNFLFIPHHPVWSVLVIGLDIAIIMGLVMDRARDA